METFGWGRRYLKVLGHGSFQKEEALFPVVGESLKAHLPNLSLSLVRGRAYLFISEWSALIQYKNGIYPWAIPVCLLANCLSVNGLISK